MTNLNSTVAARYEIAGRNFTFDWGRVNGGIDTQIVREWNENNEQIRWFSWSKKKGSKSSSGKLSVQIAPADERHPFGVYTEVKGSTAVAAIEKAIAQGIL